LHKAAARHSGIEGQLDAWFRIARKADWKNLQDVRETYATADGVTVGPNTYTVFNIAGNKFRLIVKIEYRYRAIYVKDVLTHAEYDKGRWKV
jgi:mRNA interferase HigB